TAEPNRLPLSVVPIRHRTPPLDSLPLSITRSVVPIGHHAPPLSHARRPPSPRPLSCPGSSSRTSSPLAKSLARRPLSCPDSPCPHLLAAHSRPSPADQLSRLVMSSTSLAPESPRVTCRSVVPVRHHEHLLAIRRRRTIRTDVSCPDWPSPTPPLQAGPAPRPLLSCPGSSSAHLRSTCSHHRDRSLQLSRLVTAHTSHTAQNGPRSEYSAVPVGHRVHLLAQATTGRTRTDGSVVPVGHSRTPLDLLDVD